MGQMLSREDEEYDEQNEQQAEDANEVKEKPKRRQRNQAAVRSRKPRTATQGRTRRARANPITFEDREY